MIIRSFMDESVSAALKQVKSEMGSDAVVLKTRQVKTINGTKGYEITACLENPTAAQATNTLPDQQSVKLSRPRVDIKSEESNHNSQIDSIEAKIDQMLSLQRGETVTKNDLIGSAILSMKKSDLPASYISEFEGFLNEQSDELTESKAIHNLLVNKIDNIICLMPEFKRGDRVLIMGATASGKTSLLGKLAAKLVLNDKLPVKIHSLNNTKVGAIDEIESYAELLGIDVSDFTAEFDLQADNDKVLLVDCGSMVSSSEPEIFKKTIEAFQATHRLAVFSCLTRTADISIQAKKLKEFSPTEITFTMTDLTDCWGGLIAATNEIHAKISLMTDQPSGNGHLIQPTTEMICDKLLAKVDSNE